jgi:tRNA G18 (ribose-2'-O)-methylase SpoU
VAAPHFRHPIYVVCDDVRSLLNVGAIFRIADAARIERLYLCGITGFPPVENDPRPPWVAERAGRVIAKTALQTVSAIPWEHQPSAAAVVESLKQQGVQVVALERTRRSVPYTRIDYRFPVGLVLGHERGGVASPVLDLADAVAEIPMWGEGESLNVATAFGICVYEILRRLA